MSASDVPNALVRLLEEPHENWRALADIAIDFAPPAVARAAGVVLRDPLAEPRSVLEAVRSAPELLLDDTPLHIGSIEPETLDFAPVSTITDDVHEHVVDIDLDFGAGTHATADFLEQGHPAYEPDEADEEMPSTELDHLAPDRIEPVDDELVLVVEDDSDDDLDDDGALFDVGD